jgi:hypothetical protein
VWTGELDERSDGAWVAMKGDRPDGGIGDLALHIDVQFFVDDSWHFAFCTLKRLQFVVSLSFASWNQLDGWLRQVDGLRRAA